MEYTSFNQPSSQAGAAGPDGRIRYTWQYDEGLARLKEVQRIASGADASTRTTWRMHPDNAGGLGFEHEVSVPDVWSPANPNTRQSRHYVTAMGQVVAVLVTEGNLPVLADDTVRTPPEPSQITLRKVEFWQTDHLGSLITTADHMAKVTARYAYDPFGQRRFTDGQADGAQTLAIDWDPAVRQGTGHGFTGHEHLDDIGLVHMNGRLYAARLGVFMQPDPFIQEVDNLQNLHRYGYCFANPMGCRDPSGMIFKWLGRKIKAEWKRSALFGMAASIAVSYWLGPTGGFFDKASYGLMETAISGFAGGAVSSGNLEGALQGAFTASVFFGAGKLAAAAEFGDVAKVALHGVAGCVTSVAGGGKCGPGALSASFSKAATVGKLIPENYIGGTIASAVVGGTASVLGGGKFANGAQTAAFGYLFNELMSRGDVSPGDRLRQAGYPRKLFAACEPGTGQTCFSAYEPIRPSPAEVVGYVVGFSETASSIADGATLVCLVACQPAVPAIRAVGMTADTAKFMATGDWEQALIDFVIPAAVQQGAKPFASATQNFFKEVLSQSLKEVGNSAYEQRKKESGP